MDQTKVLSNSRLPKRISRIAAVQYLFTSDRARTLNKDLGHFESNSILSILEENKLDKDLYERIIDGVEEKHKEIDKMIVKYAPSWPLDQINPVDLNILRVGIWECVFSSKTPFKVAINEAIELAKVMSSETNGKFINGVLGSIYKDYQDKEKTDE